MKPFLSLLLALLMLLSLAACGGDQPVENPADDTADGIAEEPQTGEAPGPAGAEATDGEVAGGTDGFGDFASILVPEKFTFERDSWNEENPHFVSVKRSDFAYFDFHNYTSEESMRQNYEYNQGTYTNEQTEVSATYSGIDWTGFQYSDGMGGYGFEVYTILGINYLQVSSAGFSFDSEIAKAVLGSVVMAEGSDVDTSGLDRTDTEVGGGYHGSLDWMDYWTGSWYGWWMMTDGTGLYENMEPGIWDACAYIEGHEGMDGYMDLWDRDFSFDDPIAGIDLSFANPDDTEFGVMCCRGGWFFSDTLEDDAWYVDPNQLAYENIFDFRGSYEDEDGTFSYRVLLRPWGTIWDDLDEKYYPEHYYDWYLPLVEAGADMPDTIG